MKRIFIIIMSTIIFGLFTAAFIVSVVEALKGRSLFTQLMGCGVLLTVWTLVTLMWYWFTATILDHE